MLKNTLTALGLLMILSSVAVAAEAPPNPLDDERGSGRVKTSQCRKPGDVRPDLPKCTLTSLPEYKDGVSKPRPLPSCVNRGDCILSRY